MQDASLNLYLCVLLRRQPVVTIAVVSGLGGDKFMGLYLPHFGIELKCVGGLWARGLKKGVREGVLRH